MNKQAKQKFTDTDNSMVVTRVKEGEGVAQGKGGPNIQWQKMIWPGVMDEQCNIHIMYHRNVHWTPLTNVILINLI